MSDRRLSILPTVALVLLALTWGNAVRADDQAGVALLFAKNPGKLSETERLEIYKKLGLKMGADGKTLVDDSCGQEVSSRWISATSTATASTRC